MGLFKTKEEKKAQDELKVREILKDIIVPNEVIKNIWSAEYDFCITTDKRFIYIDKKGIKKEQIITSVPYAKINFISAKQIISNNLLKGLIIGVSGKDLEFEFSDAIYTKEVIQEIATMML